MSCSYFLERSAIYVDLLVYADNQNRSKISTLKEPF